jgi:predicted dehydrogenase
MPDKIRLGLIGAGVRGTWSARSHLPALQASTDVELTAVCTTRADSAEAARQAWGARLAFDDYRRMIASPEIDAVAVVVRVPSHYAPTKAALEAGKHVYCEWPLGRTTAEAVELAALAKAKGLVTAVGLQARVNPAMMHMKEQVEAGFLGEVMAVHVSLMREGVLSRPSHRTWQRDAELGANTLTIANGHTVDAMRFVAGDFSRLSAVVATQASSGSIRAPTPGSTSPRPTTCCSAAGWRMAPSCRSTSAPFHSPAAAIAWKSTAATGPWSPWARILRN